MGSQRVGHNWATSLSLSPFLSWEPVGCHILSSRGRPASVLSSHATFGPSSVCSKVLLFQKYFALCLLTLDPPPNSAAWLAAWFPGEYGQPLPVGSPGSSLVSELWWCQFIMKSTLATWSHPCLTQAPVLKWLKILSYHSSDQLSFSITATCSIRVVLRYF